MAVLDSGKRREFETGAVRDITTGKGRCDLLPLRVVADLMEDDIILLLSQYQAKGEVQYILEVILEFSKNTKLSLAHLILETAIQFEDGAIKYGDSNWQKGIPTSVYLDSGVRHYLKYLRGDNDERHDRSFIWNMLCLIWTNDNKPEMINIPLKN